MWNLSRKKKLRTKCVSVKWNQKTITIKWCFITIDRTNFETEIVLNSIDILISNCFVCSSADHLSITWYDQELVNAKKKWRKKTTQFRADCAFDIDRFVLLFNIDRFMSVIFSLHWSIERFEISNWSKRNIIIYEQDSSSRFAQLKWASGETRDAITMIMMLNRYTYKCTHIYIQVWHNTRYSSTLFNGSTRYEFSMTSDQTMITIEHIDQPFNRDEIVEEIDLSISSASHFSPSFLNGFHLIKSIFQVYSSSSPFFFLFTLIFSGMTLFSDLHLQPVGSWQFSEFLPSKRIGNMNMRSVSKQFQVLSIHWELT